jgi:hypothetical protein
VCLQPQTAFISTGANTRAVLALSLSASRRFVAAAELPCQGEQQHVAVYNVAAEKQERVLELAGHTRSNAVAALTFRCVGQLHRPNGSQQQLASATRVRASCARMLAMQWGRQAAAGGQRGAGLGGDAVALAAGQGACCMQAPLPPRPDTACLAPASCQVRQC